jgi:two-component system response regulator HydG
MRVLVVDDEKDFRDSLERALRAMGHDVEKAATGAEGLQKARGWEPAALLLDVNMPDLSGTDLMPDLRALPKPPSIVMITGQASSRGAVLAMKLGAQDYLEKPFDLDELRLVLQRLEEKSGLRQELELQRQRRVEDCEQDFLMLGDPAMAKLYRELKDVAPREKISVLIQGETGTGKEHAAKLLHLCSGRSKGPFVELHCAALPEALLESELFGFEAGAFTGAQSRKAGLFELAQGGTLFLDEIGELPLATQTKLLKVLEEKSMRRLGGLENLKLDVRIVTATNRDLEAESAAGRFRSDLYYRLNVVRLLLPPLRERPADLRQLAQHFLSRAAAEFGKRLDPLSEEALLRLGRHSWPGNVRELKNSMERLAVQVPGPTVSLEDLDEAIPRSRAAAAPPPAPELDRASLERALQEAGGDKSRAAALLGVSRPTLYRHLKRHGL